MNLIKKNVLVKLFMIITVINTNVFAMKQIERKQVQQEDGPVLKNSLLEEIFQIIPKTRIASNICEFGQKDSIIGEIKGVLKDCSFENNLKKSIKNFIKITLGIDINLSEIFEPSSQYQTGFSGDLIFFIRSKTENLSLVVKVYKKPFNDNSTFIKELSGYQATCNINPKGLNVVKAKAVGRCIIDEEDFGLLAISIAPGKNMKEIMYEFIKVPINSYDRTKMISDLEKIFEKLGAGMVEFNNQQIKEDSKISTIAIASTVSDFQKMIKYLEKSNSYGIDIINLKAYFANLLEKIKHEKTTLKITHRDSHLGNFMYDEETKTISILDFEYMHCSVDEKGDPTWSGIYDYTNILESLLTFKHLGLTEKEYFVFKEAFKRGYGETQNNIIQEFFGFSSRLATLNWLFGAEINDPETFAKTNFKKILDECSGKLKNPCCITKDF